jgi:pyrimidine-nucleoside phosphorylase
MRVYDIIAKKRDGGEHTRAELEYMVNGYAITKEIKDYQMAAWLMAIYLRGMTPRETAELTDVMAHSGEMVDLSPIAGIKVDKHSTGGVGDKTTLVIAPVVAACGVPIAKMSGRGLGHTGGTIDKMESVPGTKTALSQEEFFAQVNDIGISVIGQSQGIAVADKYMYGLRDVTATVSCIPLIASSVMSKKLASGSDAILLDVTTGTGAFMKTVEDSIELAKVMVDIGTRHGRRMAALITDMDTPLGHNIGNSLEVMESMEVLKERGPSDLTEVCLQLATNMLMLAGKGNEAECRAMAQAVIADGSAFAKCKQMFAAQGGDVRVLDDYSLFAQPKASFELLAEQDGYIVENDAEKIGIASVLLGAGRQKKEDSIDLSAGIILHKKRGDYVHKGESLATFYGEESRFAAAAETYRSGMVYGDAAPKAEPLVYARVTSEGVTRFDA